jgi:YbbR domain-containing protein
MNLTLTENWLLKLLAIAFALVLWFFVMGEQNLEKGFAVPLELQGVPDGMVVSNEVPRLVDVRISGPRTVLMNLQANELGLTLDLKELPPGITSFKRLDERFRLPRTLKVTRMAPAVIDVRLERLRNKKVPVRVTLTGDPSEGFYVVSMKATPARVVVSGAESELKSVNEIPTEVIDLTDVKESFSQIVSLDYIGKYSELKEDKTTDVRVEIAPVTTLDKGKK